MDFQQREVSVIERIEISNLLPEIGVESIQNEMLEGLQRSEKYISSKFFYNEKGSVLFEQITQLKEYYPTRTEKSILTKTAPSLMEGVYDTQIVELGSGDCSKISILLDAISNANYSNINYIPVDVSSSAIETSADGLINRYPDLNIQGYVADFMGNLDFLPHADKRLLCFFGSTIGNLLKIDAEAMMKRISAAMNKGDKLLLGMDLVKEEAILNAAYNDAEGVTAAFNKNIVNKVNDVIGTSFDAEKFEHNAFFNKEKMRIEMHLIATENMTQFSPYSPTEIWIKKGESIHTENSHKYTFEDIDLFAKISGLVLKTIHTDENKWFGLAEFIKE